jgi:hypothetical protein
MPLKDNTIFGWTSWMDSKMCNRKITMSTKYSRALKIIFEKHGKWPRKTYSAAITDILLNKCQKMGELWQIQRIWRIVVINTSPKWLKVFQMHSHRSLMNNINWTQQPTITRALLTSKIIRDYYTHPRKPKFAQFKKTSKIQHLLDMIVWKYQLLMHA